MRGRREHALFVLGEIDKCVTMAGKHNAETCVDYDDAAEAERTGQRQLQQARHRLLLVVNAIQGDGFPFARFGDFQRFYNGVHWNDHASSTDFFWTAILTTDLKQIYRLVQRNTTVNRSQVRVTLPRGQQKVSTRFTGKKWGFLEKNWLYFSVSESMPGGGQLQTARFSRNCSGKNSAYHCYGSTPSQARGCSGPLSPEHDGEPPDAVGPAGARHGGLQADDHQPGGDAGSRPGAPAG